MSDDDLCESCGQDFFSIVLCRDRSHIGACCIDCGGCMHASHSASAYVTIHKEKE